MRGVKRGLTSPKSLKPSKIGTHSMDNIEPLVINIRKGQIKHLILQMLARDEIVKTTQLLHGSAKLETLERYKELHMNVLRDAGLVRKMPADSWSITAEGLARVRELGLEPPTPNLAKAKSFTTSGTYDGKELQRHCMRAGAYDAFDLPSRMMGK